MLFPCNHSHRAGSYALRRIPATQTVTEWLRPELGRCTGTALLRGSWRRAYALEVSAELADLDARSATVSVTYGNCVVKLVPEDIYVSRQVHN